MKNKQKHRLLIGGAAFFALCLTGCAGAAELPDMNRCFTVTADITCGELSASAELSRIDEYEWEVLMLSPFALEGIKFRIDSDSETAYLGDMSASGAGVSAVSSLVSAIETAISAENPACTAVETGISFDGGDFTLVVAKNGAPLSLEYGALSVSFGETVMGEACGNGELPRLEG